MRPRHSLSAVNEGGVNYHDDIYDPEVHQVAWTGNMSACYLFGSRQKGVLAHAAHKVKGEVAVTAVFVPFKVPGSPLVEKTVFHSPLSICVYKC